MRRREFITLAGGAVAAWPLTAFGKTQRIALVHPTHPVTALTENSPSPGIRAIFTEFRRLGYVEGKNLVVERYSGEGRADHYPDLAREVVASNPDLIIAITDNLVTDLKAATTTIPIVGMFSDPVETGILRSLAKPDGNVTGVTLNIGIRQWWEKRVQLLVQAVPQLSRLGVLRSKTWPHPSEGEVQEMFQALGITAAFGGMLNYPVNEKEYRRAFAALVKDRADAIIVSEDVENITNRNLIIDLAERNKLPAIYPLKVFVENGGLMSYGSSQLEHGRNLADAADKIIKGAKPSDIPVMQPTQYELTVNLKTAKALGLTVPATLLVAADQVIE
jgi:putative ABC transport system substrate-binding protein